MADHHETVGPATGEFARDADSDGFCAGPVTTWEELGSLLRSRHRPHRGIAQEKLPRDLGVFVFVQNVGGSGNALLGELIGLLAPSPRIPTRA